MYQPEHIIPNKYGAKKEHNCQHNVNNDFKVETKFLADTGSTLSIIPKHFIIKYHLLTTREKCTVCKTNQRHFKKKIPFERKIGVINKLKELFVIENNLPYLLLDLNIVISFN